MIALGAEMRRRGHRVTLVASPYFESTAAREGLDFVPLGSVEDYERAMQNPDLWHPRRGFELVARGGIVPAIRPVYELVASHDPADTVVAASALCLGARVAQEKLGARLVTVHLQPSMLRSLFDTPAMPGLRFPPWTPRFIKRAFFRFADRQVLDRLLAPELNALRAELGLPPVGGLFAGWLHSTLRVVGLFPDWFAPPQPDWPQHTALTGFVSHDSGAAERPADELLAFLDAGDAPIVFTPGTAMTHGRPFFDAALDAAARLGRRALLVTRHRSQLPDALPATALHVDYAPFGWLLPRAAALVHHGGIGTLAHGLAAGVPQLLMPMSHDQPDNAMRLARLGVGDSLPAARFRGPAVAARLARLLGSADVTRRCAELAERVDFRTTLRNTCDLLENP